MFKKVLIAEDFDTINLAVTQTLQEMNIINVEHCKYCDEALLKIKKAQQIEKPFDLLISDISFNQDHRQVKIKSGEELIKLAKIEQPSLKIIAYSIEEKSALIKSLMNDYNINAYVHKGRNSMMQLNTAINTIFQSNEKYISPQLAETIREKSSNEIDNYDLELIRQLSQGISQGEMENRFIELGITPNKKSTIEKKIARLKDFFKANNTTHLISIAKDLGII